MADRRNIGNTDAALEELGAYGRYSMVQFFIHAFAQVAIVHHLFSIVFTGQKNPFRCPSINTFNGSEYDHTGSNYLAHANDNASEPAYADECYTRLHIYHDGLHGNISTCTAYTIEYQLPKNTFFVSEFDLVCDREYLVGLTQTLLTVGHVIGTFIFPYFADNYGRRPVLLLCSFLWLGSSLGLAFSVSYTMFAVFKTLVGVFQQGVSLTSLTVTSEILTGRQRGFMFGCLLSIFVTLSMMLMAAMAYLLRDYSWRVLELVYCSYFIYILFYVFFMDEPLRWLASNGFHERIIRILKKASKWNGRNVTKIVSAFYEQEADDEIKQSDNMLMLAYEKDYIKFDIEISQIETQKVQSKIASNEMAIENSPLQDGDCVDQKLNISSLFTNRFLWFHTVFCLIAWFFNNMAYFALFLMSSTLSGSIYMNYFLNCIVEIPPAVFIYFNIDRLGRKVCFVAFTIIAGVSLAAMALTVGVSDEQAIVVTVLAMIGKFGVTGSFSTLFILTPELFPTNIRNTAQGFTGLGACLGGMIAPFAELLMKEVVYAPGLIFGVGSLILSILTYFLPETARRQLPQSVKDIEEWSNSSNKGNDFSNILHPL